MIVFSNKNNSNSNTITGNYAEKAAFILSQSLPGFPVTKGLSLAFIPSLSAATLDNTDLNTQKVLSIVDTGTGLTLSSNGTTIMPPDLKYSENNGFWYMETDGSTQGLALDDFPISKIVSEDGKCGSIVCISTLNASNQFNFGWVKKTGVNTYDKTKRYGVHFPWTDNIFYFDFGSTSSGRVKSNKKPTIPDDETIRCICLTKSATKQKITVDYTTIASGNPKDSFAGTRLTETGYLSFAHSMTNKGEQSNFSKMRCFAFLLFNRTLTNEEVGKINEWKNRKIKSVV